MDKVSNQNIPAKQTTRKPSDKIVVTTDEFLTRDPFIMLYNNQYYFYGSSFGNGVRCLVSDDLELWREPVLVYEKPENFHGTKCLFWAPECHYYKGNFYIFTSVFSSRTNHRNISVYRSSDPLGPFEDIAGGCVGKPDWDTIDGTFYVDEEGQPWMMFVHEWTSMPDKIGAMCVAKLSEDLSHFISEPLQIFRATDNIHARNNVTDGPYLYRTDGGKLMMIWSNHGEKGYFIAKAYSKNGKIDGKWVQENELLYACDLRPEFTMDGGHAMIFPDKEGKMLITFHVPNDSRKYGCKERLVIYPIIEKNNTIVLGKTK